jgi:DNA (cytosine-5)-methyltransferase 1
VDAVTLTVTDLFCGAGGSSIGAERAGATLRMAANHWDLAIETHNSNFPNADHDCADVSQVEPRRYPATDILIASPECTTHSQAGPRRHEPNLFDPNGDPSVERSRATMWDVARFAEVHNYRAIIVENVVDILRWKPFHAWLSAMDSLGYAHQLVSLNSMVAHPTPQSRDRLYIVFWQRKNRRPDLDIRPVSWCMSCDKQVAGIQSFKRTDRIAGKYRQQYVYRCPSCAGVALPFAWPAASAIDWNLPNPRIGDRTRPLAEATMRRIRIGLKRFGPSIVQKSGHTYEAPGSGYSRSWPIAAPLPVQTTETHHALVVPYTQGTEPAQPSDRPMATIVTRDKFALVVPVHHSAAGPGAQPASIPWPTQTGRQEQGFLTVLRSGQLPRHEIYVEPFCGSASILFAKAPSRYEVINDVDGELVHFFEILRTKPVELAEACRWTPYARDELIGAQTPTADPVERARRYWIRSTQSFNGRVSQQRSWGCSVVENTWRPRSVQNKIDRLHDCARRLLNVAIENVDANDVIRRFAKPGAVIYADPPYLFSSRRQQASGSKRNGYEHEMGGLADHERLAESLHKAAGGGAIIFLSGYPSPEYDRLYADWYRAERSVAVHASAWTGSARGRATEILYSNRPLVAQERLA